MRSRYNLCRVWIVALVSQRLKLFVSPCAFFVHGCIKVNEWFSVRSKRKPTNMTRKNGLIIQNEIDKEGAFHFTKTIETLQTRLKFK